MTEFVSGPPGYRCIQKRIHHRKPVLGRVREQFAALEQSSSINDNFLEADSFFHLSLFEVKFDSTSNAHASCLRSPTLTAIRKKERKRERKKERKKEREQQKRRGDRKRETLIETTRARTRERKGVRDIERKSKKERREIEKERRESE